MISTRINNSWDKILQDEFKKPYFKNLVNFLDSEKKAGKVIFPPSDDIFNAFKHTAFDNVKVVILGQDPYHGSGQAHGLCFSVKPDIKTPPSLKNIYKEMNTDLGLEPVNHGYLINWADQGILMLNAVLTVEQSKPGSHRKRGWEIFTDRVIEILNQEKENLVFILWGNDARKKKSMLDESKHYIIESAHPSPFSVKNFYGTQPFSKTNNYLKNKGIEPVNWSLL